MRIQWSFLRIGRPAPMAYVVTAITLGLASCAPHQTSVSADGSVVAVRQGNDLAIGSPAHLQTIEGAGGDDIALSPDGSELAVARQATGMLYHVRSRQWTNLPDMWGPYAWSEDGSELVGCLTELQGKTRRFSKLRVFDVSNGKVESDLAISQQPNWVVLRGGIVCWEADRHLWLWDRTSVRLVHSTAATEFSCPCEMDKDRSKLEWFEPQSTGEMTLMTYDLATHGFSKQPVPSPAKILGRSYQNFRFGWGEIRPLAGRYGLLIVNKQTKKNGRIVFVFTDTKFKTVQEPVDLLFHVKPVKSRKSKLRIRGEVPLFMDGAWSADGHTFMMSGGLNAAPIKIG